MEKIDYTKHIVPTKFELKKLDPSLDKSDNAVCENKIFLPTKQELKKDPNYAFTKSTDFFAMQQTMPKKVISMFLMNDNGKKKENFKALISNDGTVHVVPFKYNESYQIQPIEVCPRLRLSLCKNVLNDSTDPKNFDAGILNDIKKTLTVPNDDKPYATIKLGEYVTDKVDASFNSMLEQMFTEQYLKNSDKQKQLKIVNSILSNSNFFSSTYLTQEFVLKQIPVFELDGKRYARVVCSPKYENKKVEWLKVEPLEFRVINYEDLTKELNPNGKNKTAVLDLVSTNMLFSNIALAEDDLGFTRSINWIDSTIRLFLNGMNDDKENEKYFSMSKGKFEQYGGFLNDAFNLTRPLATEFYVPKDCKLLSDYALSGCVNLKRIYIHDNITSIHNKAFDDTNIKFVYKQKDKKGIVFATELPKDMQDIYDVICLDVFSKDNRYIKYSWFTKNHMNDQGFHWLSQFTTAFHERCPKLDATYFVLMFMYRLNSYALENNSINWEARQIADALLNIAQNGELSFFQNEFDKFMPHNIDGDHPTDGSARMVILLAHALGAFSNQKLTDKFGNETDVLLSQKACSFLTKLKKQILRDDNLNGETTYLKILSDIFPSKFISPNPNVLKFLSVQGANGVYENIEMLCDMAEIRERQKYDSSFIDCFYEHFDEINALRNSVNEKGLPCKIPFSQAFEKYLVVKEFGTENVNDLQKEYAKFGFNKNQYDDANKLYFSAKIKKVPEHILGKPLSEIDNMINKIDQQFIQSKTLLDKAYDNQFKFEMLSKKDAKNALIGLYASCCALLTGTYYGAEIAKRTIIEPDVQNIVIKDKHNQIIAKGAMYVNSEDGYCLINDFEINDKYRQVSKSEYAQQREKSFIFEAFIRGIRNFVLEYDKLYPDNPIKQVNVGGGYNALATECEIYAFKHYNESQNGKHKLKAPAEYDFQDTIYTQYVLYDRNYENSKLSEQMEDEQNAK